MSVHYKFKSNLSYDTVTFDGLHISIGDLKKAIMHQKKIGKSADFDLQITNAQTNEVYSNDEDLIPKNSSVTVARVPVGAVGKKSWERSEAPSLIQDSDSPGHVQYDKLSKTADLVNAVASEDDKIKAMMTQSTQEYDPSKYVKSRTMTGPLPPNYTCYRCGKPGHWIKNCPTNTVCMDIKRSTGIPRSFMVPVDGPEHKGALLTATGEFAVPLIDHQAYKEVKKEKPPFLKEPEMPAEPEKPLPEELLCMVCNDLLQDAVLIPCCGNSFCDECVRQVLLDSENHECPMCHEIDISPDHLIPNRYLRTAVLNFKNETGYTRVKKIYQSITQLPPESNVALEPPVEKLTLIEGPPPLLERPPPVERPALLETPVERPPLLATPSEAPEPVAQPPPEPEVPLPAEADSTVVDDDGRSGTPLADEPSVEFEASEERHGSSACSSPSNSVHYGADVAPPGEQPIGPSNEHSIMTITTRGPDYMNCGPIRNFIKDPPVRSIRPNVSTQILGPSSHHSRSSRGDHSSHRLSPPHKSLHSGRLSRYPATHPGSVSHSRAGYSHTSHSLSRFGSNNRPAPSNPVPPSILPLRHSILPPPFPPQPPPPGASPHSHAPPVPAQPPPPGVGPVHPVVPIPSHAPFPREYGTHVPNFTRDPAFHGPRDRNWTGSRDTYDDITRKFLDYQCNQNRRPRRRGSRSRSRSYGSSKSRSTSPRWSRSRSSSFSRSRSYSRSRSRSYSHSRSRSRSYHRSRSRSPSRRRKARSPRRYYRSKSRSPRKYVRPHYPHSSRLDYPPDYYGISAPPYSGSVPSSQPPSHFKGSRSSSYYHEQFTDYDAYPHVGSRYDSSSTGYSGRYGQNYYSDLSRKPHSRDWDPQHGSSSSWKDSHSKRTDASAVGTTPDKPKENSDSDSASKKKDKLKQKKHHHHHRHKESKKSSKYVEVPKEKKMTAHKPNLSTGVEKVKKEGRIVSLSKDKLVIEQVEILQKDKKHKHKKSKDGESSKKRKKKSSSEDVLHGGEVEKIKKKRKKTNLAANTQSTNDQINKEMSDNQKTQEDHKNPDNPSSIVIETNVEEGASDPLDGTPLEMGSPVNDSHVTAEESLPEVSLTNLNQNTSTESTSALTNESNQPEDDENISLKEEEEEAEEGEIDDDDEDGSAEEDKLNELQVQMPEISKWERDDYDSAEETELPRDHKAELEEGKSTLSSDIIQKAEKALLHKALKSAIIENPSRKRQVERPSEDEKTANSGSRQKSEKVSSDKERSKMQNKFGLGPFNKLQRNVTIKFGEIKHLKGMPLQNKRSVFVQPVETKKKEDDTQKSETQVKKIKDEPTTRSDSALIKRNAKKQDTNPTEKQRHGSISKRDEKGEHKRGDSKEQVSHSSQLSVDAKKEPKDKSPHVHGNKQGSQESKSASVKATVKSEERTGREKLDEDGSVKNRTVTSHETSARNQSSSKKSDGNKGSSSSDKTGKSSVKTKDSTEDESKFEPNYDETSDSDTGAEHDGTHVSKKRKITLEDGRNSKRLKGGENDLEAGKKLIDEGSTSSRIREKSSEHKHQRSGRSRGESGVISERKKQQPREAIQSYVVAQKKRSDSVSSEASSSSSSEDSDSSSVKKKAQSESTDSDQKHRLKKSKHRKHKKRKHKHKKKKSHRVRERDEIRLSSSIVRR